MSRRESSRLRIPLDKRTARAVAGGHPWVWRDVLEQLPRAPRAGEEVVLLDAVGGFLATGLAEGPDGTGPGVRVLSLEERDPPLRKLLFRRVAAARRLRERCVDESTTALRLIHGEGDHLPGLVVDRYGPVLVVRPDSGAWEPHLSSVVEALRSEGGPGISTILLKPRRGEARLLSGEAIPEELVVQEEGRRFLVRPGFGQKTGFFCDQRPTRSLVQRLSRPGDRALNLFSFTGGFSVAMALGGASEVVSVDLSESILGDCRRQFELNGIDPAGHQFLARDIFRWLPEASGSAGRFDVLVCDPPALAHSKDDLPRARAAYRRLHEGLAPLVSRGGILVTCSCTSRLGPDDLLEDARAGLRAGNRTVSRVLSRSAAGPDHPVPPGFPQGHYLSCLVLALD